MAVWLTHKCAPNGASLIMARFSHKKRAVCKNWIEELVLAKTKAIVVSNIMVDFISQKTYNYNAAQNTDTSYTDSLHAGLARVKTATDGLIYAMKP